MLSFNKERDDDDDGEDGNIATLCEHVKFEVWYRDRSMNLNKTELAVGLQGGWKKVSCWHSTTAYFFWATLYM